MSKVYSFEDSQQVIKDAWNKAIKNLEDTLGEQYGYNATKHAWEKFQDYVEQDIEFKMTCPCCGNVDIEGNFLPSLFEPNVNDLLFLLYRGEFKMIISIQDSPMYGGFRFNKEPITSTHKCIKTHRYIRTTGKEFVEEYVLGKWEESYTITNEEVLQTNRRGYIKLFKTGIDKSICNFVQWVLKSDYRIS